jgi:hypothetical protein
VPDDLSHIRVDDFMMPMESASKRPVAQNVDPESLQIFYGIGMQGYPLASPHSTYHMIDLSC